MVKNIKIPEALFAQKKFGTIKIQVPKGGVCSEHQFIVFVDTKGIIRGYEKIDLLMKTPSEQKEEPGLYTLRRLIELFGLYGVFSLIHSKIFNYPAYILKGTYDEDYTDVVNTIGDQLLPPQYKGTTTIQFIEGKNYNKIRLDEKDSFLMDSHNNILQTPWENKLKFEEELVKKAIEIINEDEQIKIIQQYIANFIRDAECAKQIVEDIKEIYEEDLIDKISRELMNPKMKPYRITLIKEFIKRRFSSKLAGKIKSKVEEFLGLL